MAERATPIRVLIAKPGLDGHDRGAKVCDEFGQQRCMGTREDGATDNIDIFFNGSSNNRVNGAAQPGVDHFKTFVTEPACQHLGAAVMAVETRLGDQHANWRHALSHGVPRVAPCRDRVRAPTPRAGRHRCGVIRASPRWS